MKDNALRHAQLSTNTNDKRVSLLCCKVLKIIISTSTLTSSVVPSTAEPASESDGENFQLNRERRIKLNKKAKRDKKKLTMYK